MAFLSFDDSLSLFLPQPVKTSSLSDRASKVTANNGALLALIRAQGMKWQWRISAPRLYEATQLSPLPPLLSPQHTIKPLRFSATKQIKATFVLAWHHCFVFIKISPLLWHRGRFCSLSKQAASLFFLFPEQSCSLIFDFFFCSPRSARDIVSFKCVV